MGTATIELHGEDERGALMDPFRAREHYEHTFFSSKNNNIGRSVNDPPGGSGRKPARGRGRALHGFSHGEQLLSLPASTSPGALERGSLPRIVGGARRCGSRVEESGPSMLIVPPRVEGEKGEMIIRRRHYQFERWDHSGRRGMPACFLGDAQRPDVREGAS